MNYEQMSDFEINKLVACKTEFFTKEPRAFDDRCFNPCNSWADAGPIIEEHGISLRKLFLGTWRAVNEWGYSYSCDNENPLRAAMIVLLMMHTND